MKLKIKRMHPDVQMPTYASAGAACFDIRAYTPKADSTSFNDTCVFDTGLKVEVPEGHVMLIFSRSGHGFNSGVRLANCTGVIDSDYRGELLVKLATDGFEGFSVAHGDRIAQAMVIPCRQIDLVEGELSETDRGENGFGSTGVK